MKEQCQVMKLIQMRLPAVTLDMKAKDKGDGTSGESFVGRGDGLLGGAEGRSELRTQVCHRGNRRAG